ncbi:MAG: hypothetical protein CR964_01065 [Rhodobacterales bacterium]|nr:MAG: hypothetical protein CR964_01065 [Rhodobacterales bacterium]
MAYKLGRGNKTIEWKATLKDGMLSCYDCIGDPDFDWEMDHLLHYRSALEFVRDRLNDAQRAELDEIDVFWRTHFNAFNQCFAAEHARRAKVSLKGFVEDDNGEVPPIPRSHWWWRPIEDRAD